jgi:hypothetical protein
MLREEPPSGRAEGAGVGDTAGAASCASKATLLMVQLTLGEGILKSALSQGRSDPSCDRTSLRGVPPS